MGDTQAMHHSRAGYPASSAVVDNRQLHHIPVGTIVVVVVVAAGDRKAAATWLADT
jgi:cytosine/adenosine deaminase-related metal-dependent hydrolase